MTHNLLNLCQDILSTGVVRCFNDESALFNILPFDDSSNALTLKKGRKKVAKSFPFLAVRSSVFILSVSTKLSLKQQKIAEIPHPS